MSEQVIIHTCTKDMTPEDVKEACPVGHCIDRLPIKQLPPVKTVKFPLKPPVQMTTTEFHAEGEPYEFPHLEQMEFERINVNGTMIVWRRNE